MKKFVGDAEGIKAQLDVKTEQELSRLLQDQGKRVAMPLNTKTLEAGSSHVFGLGILNINSAIDEFTVDISFSKAIDDEQNAYTPDQPGVIKSYILYDPGPFSLTENQYESVPILVDVPKDAKKGTYIFNVKVTSKIKAAQYDNTKKFYVTIV